MTDTIQNSKFLRKNAAGHGDRPKKRNNIKKQISERAKTFLAPTENERIHRDTYEAGLSEELIRSWTKGSKPVPNNPPVDNMHPAGSNLANNSQVTLATSDQNSRQINSEQIAPNHAFLLHERRVENMNDVIELRRVARAFLRWWWLVLLVTMIAAVAGFAISLKLKPVYRASTSVIVGQSIEATSLDSRDIQTSERLALSYADITRRQPVLEAVNVSLNLGHTWQDLRKRVQVELVPDTQLIEISVEADSRDEAIMIADEIARQLILISPTSVRNQEDENTSLFVETRLQTLQDKIEFNQERLNEMADELLVTETLEQKIVIRNEIERLEKLIVDWETNYARFLSYVGNEESINYLAVVEKAHGKYSPIRPKIRLNTIVAGTVGLALAVGLVFLLEFLDDTLKSAYDISQELRLVPLGSVGQFGGKDYQKTKIAANDLFSPLAESYRMIRNNIQYMSVDKPRKSILVTSPGPGDGKSFTAANLSIVMALNGQRTILVDTDLRNPRLHTVFQVTNDQGLSDLFRDTESKCEIPLTETEIEGLRLLTVGSLPPNPSELLGSQRMKQLITDLMEDSDVLIFDSSPAAFIADATVLSKHVDSVVMVVSAGKTRRDIAQRAVFNLQQAGANILGVVLNRASENNGKYKYYSSAKKKRRPIGKLPTIFHGIWGILAFTNWRNRRMES